MEIGPLFKVSSQGLAEQELFFSGKETSVKFFVLVNSEPTKAEQNEWVARRAASH